jgi:hypothetical protein
MDKYKSKSKNYYVLEDEKFIEVKEEEMKKFDTVYVINGINIDKLIKNDKGEFIYSDKAYVINGKNIYKLTKNDEEKIINSNTSSQYNNDHNEVKPEYVGELLVAHPVKKDDGTRHEALGLSPASSLKILAVLGVAIIGITIYAITRKKKNKHHTHKKDNDLDSDTD